MSDETSVDLVTRWRGGDQQAAAELFRRYTARLLALARSRLSAQLARRVDPEDVVQSAYRSFFAGIRANRYALERSGDLWRLLVAVTLHKLHHQVKRHTAGKRAITREQHFEVDGSLPGLPVELVSRNPSPAEALALLEELDQVLRGLSPLHRMMLEMRLQGAAVEEIAAASARSERMVRLVLEQVRNRLRQH